MRKSQRKMGEKRMEQVLLFQVQHEEAAEIADMLAAMKVKCREIPVQAYRQTIGELAAGGRNEERPEFGRVKEEYKGEVPDESMMLFCDMGEKHFNRILAHLRSRAVKVTYKAVLTPTNREWNVLRLYAELAREKAEYERMRQQSV